MTKSENLDTPFSYFYDLRQVSAQAVNLLSVTVKMHRLSATKCMQHTAFRSSALRPLRSEVESARARPRRSRPSVTWNAPAPNGSGAGAIPPNMPSWSRVRHKISVWSRFLFKGFFEYLICALPCLARKNQILPSFKSNLFGFAGEFWAVEFYFTKPWIFAATPTQTTKNASKAGSKIKFHQLVSRQMQAKFYSQLLSFSAKFWKF